MAVIERHPSWTDAFGQIIGERHHRRQRPPLGTRQIDERAGMQIVAIRSNHDVASGGRDREVFIREQIKAEKHASVVANGCFDFLTRAGVSRASAYEKPQIAISYRAEGIDQLRQTLIPTDPSERADHVSVLWNPEMLPPGEGLCRRSSD